jgi:hypothetical protein
VKITVARFDSWEEFIAAAEVRSYGGSDSGHTKGNSHFYGTDSLPEAASLARKGWAEGAERVQAIRAEITASITAIVNARVQSIGYDVAGDYVDIGRYLSGEPECFGTRIDDPGAAKPVVKVSVNTAVSCGVSQEAIFARGAAVLAAIDVIESTGKRVELWAVNGALSCDDRKTHETYVLVKSADQHLDCDRLAFALCHAATHRRLCFSVFEKYGLTAGGTYPHGVTDRDGVYTPEARRRGTFSKRELLEEVKRICDAAGVEIAEQEIDSLCAS